MLTKAHDALFGVAVADALGVPVEFQSREQLQSQPVTDMRAFGTYQQPMGTWSDDSSLTFCLADSLVYGYDLADQARRFVQWHDHALWTPHGEVFDIGNTTSRSISMLSDILQKGDLQQLSQLKNYSDENFNGNGSLMRILPLYFYLYPRPIEEQFNTIRQASALTHQHLRAAWAGLIYLTLADEIVRGQDIPTAYARTRQRMQDFRQAHPELSHEAAHYNRLIEQDISQLPMSDIRSEAYVVFTLEAAVWCLLNHNNYPDTVLEAVNLGEDTDTTAAVAGGLAGLHYTTKGIPDKWLNGLVARDKIDELAGRLNKKYPIASPA